MTRPVSESTLVLTCVVCLRATSHSPTLPPIVARKKGSRSRRATKRGRKDARKWFADHPPRGLIKLPRLPPGLVVVFRDR